MADRFLIIKPSSLGDIIHAFPAVSMLASAFPDAGIDWVTAPAFAGMVKCHPAVDRVIFFKRKELGSITGFLCEFPKLVRELRKEPYTAVIDLQGLLRSALIGRFARAKYYWGPDAPREKIATRFYTRKMKMGDFHSHAVLKNCRMIADFLKIAMPERIQFDLPENDSTVKKLLELVPELSGPAPFAAIAPGARWITKEWPCEFFAEAANKLVQKYPDLRFLLLGSPDEKARCLQLKNSIKAPVYDLSGKTTLPELTEAIRKVCFLLCNDSGPMHIAAAVKTPVIPVFGPTDPVLTGPFQELDLVLRPGISCELCFKRTCETMECHKKIDPAQVLDLVSRNNLLEKP